MKKLIIALTVLVMAACAASAQSVGVVDYEKLQDTPLFKSIAEELSAARTNFAAELNLRKENPYLTENEVQELITEAAKNPSSARAKELQDENAKRSAEAQTLSQANPPSDEQKKRIDELSDMFKKSQKNLNNVAESMEQSMAQLVDEKTKAFDAKVSDACKAVAADKKLSIVVMKAFVLYGGTDITEDVLAKLPASL
ncbi:MAG: OmpH family outer membrane protein [Abditibacteriota bacterium]|nr:OmpH family outer membrane protein [Abditibacteriota bacterium]